MSSFAVCITIKNEATLIAENIRHHINLGAARVYIFLDGTEDTSGSIAASLGPRVTVRNTIAPHEVDEPPDWIMDILPRWQENMDVRKRINTYFAARWAQRDKIEWLYSLDADELLVFSMLADGRSNIDSNEFHGKIPTEIDQVLVRNLEAVPRPDSKDHPFISTDLFLCRHRRTEILFRYLSALFRRVVSNPAYQAWFEYIFYWLRFGGALPRLMVDPIDFEKIPAPYFLGYNNYKSGIRTSRAAHFIFDVHKWRGGGVRPKTMEFGELLHFDLPNISYFRNKFRQRQSKMFVKAFYLRYRLGKIALDASDIELRDFFNKYIALNRPGISGRLVKRGIAVRLPKNLLKM